jgi:hypothetical protein
MSPPEHPPAGGLGRLVWGTIALVLVAPLAVVALPLALLLAVSGPRSRSESVTAGLAGGFSLWWLLSAGDLPDQLVRAAALLCAVAFVALTARTRLTFMHRALAATTTAAVAVAGLVPALGSSWGELKWWVAHRTGLAARAAAGVLWSRQPLPGADDTAPATLTQLESALSAVVRLTAELFPAITVLQLVAGLALATAIYRRVAQRPLGCPAGRFREFRFSEHLGWAFAVPLVVVLIPKLVAWKTVAANALVVTGALYALRGAAVVAYGIHVVGAGGFFLWGFLAVIFLLLLPLVLGGAILLGVLDGGLDLRRRWSAPRASR